MRNTVLEKDEQYIFWNNFVHFKNFQTDTFLKKYHVNKIINEAIFIVIFSKKNLISRTCAYEREIKMDLERTFPDLDFFKDDIKLLIFCNNPFIII